MGAIDIGAGATDRSGSISQGTNTAIDLNNPANDTGTLTTLEIYVVSGYTCEGVKIGTATGASGTFDIHDYESLGSVAGGSKQSFTGLNCDVTSGDCLALWATNGEVEGAATGGSGWWYKAGDQFGAGSVSGYTQGSGRIYSLYGTGVTPTGIPLFAYHYNNMRP